jgi:carbamoyltransferase
MKIISLHNGHDASITALEDGKILYHWELERHFNRAKHFAGMHNENIIAEFLRCHALPILAWNVEEIDIISLGAVYAGSLGEAYKTSEFHSCVQKKYGKSLKKPYEIWEATWGKKNQKFFCSAHHVNHMSYSFYTSPFKESLIFAYDGEGDFNTTTTYGLGKEKKIEYLGNLTTNPRKDIIDNRIGIAFNGMGTILPFFGKEFMATPGKVMGYSSYGKIRPEWIQDIELCITVEFSKLEILLDKFNLPNNMDSQDKRAMDLVATFQYVCEEYILKTLKILMQETGQKNICLSGGCALNVLINERIRRELTGNIHIPPACSDTGQSIGSALYLWHHVLENKFTSQEWHNPYLGDFFQFNDKNYKQINRIKIEKEEDLIEKAASLLVEGKIIGWAQGRSEIGPRALGNRSILCLPTNPKMKDLINKKIKHREWWRPFAPVCLFEDFEEWFDTEDESPYMLFSPIVKRDKRNLIPAVTHIDASARLQTVKNYQNPLLHKLLTKIKEKNNIPILLNTSLNDRGKPIANHISSICDLLINTEIDCVFVGLEELKLKKIFI